LKADAQTDADVLLAAAYAASGDPRKALALRVWRLRQTGRTDGFRELVEECVMLLYKYNRGIKPAARTMKTVAEKTLFWWMNPACPHCGGLGHPIIAGTPMLDTSENCEKCGGTGVAPLESLLPPAKAAPARMLVDELNRMSAVVFSDMARRLSNELEL
jgi:hypothetical protein